jgi:hypothetical protein
VEKPLCRIDDPCIERMQMNLWVNCGRRIVVVDMFELVEEGWKTVVVVS